MEALYAEYLEDPQAVDPEWRAYFEPLKDGSGRAQLGPSFERRSVFAGGGHSATPGISALQDRVDRMVNAYRSTGHRAAHLDPLGRKHEDARQLRPERYGLSEADRERPCLFRGQRRTVGDVFQVMLNTYCRFIGVEYMHLDELAAREWLGERMETCENRIELSQGAQTRILTKLTDAEIFEKFIQKKYLGAKSFSLEGGESLIPLLDLAIERSATQGVEEIVIGMAHRGRLNVLANILNKSPGQIFREFDDTDAHLYWGRGDVKYHLGRKVEVQTSLGHRVKLHLCFNPSHLEFVNPVVEGRVRARQDRKSDGERRRVLPLLIHGDAAFAGQGVVQETLNMSQLRGYKTGGTLHVIVNNQIGFTTSPDSARSTTYSSDVAKMLSVPVFHVNGEDPESVAHVVALAMDYRARFHSDVVIDMYCYRQHGHNEGDEPAFTQPLMYELIRKRKTVRESYVEKLGLSQEVAEGIAADRQEYLEQELARAREEGFEPTRETLDAIWAPYKGGPEREAPTVETKVARERLQALLQAQAEVPEGFEPHAKVARLLKVRSEQAAGEKPLDWAAGESLGFATLLVEGHGVRLSGQDAGRGTFSHRHAVLRDPRDEQVHVPLCTLADGQGTFEVWDSPLSETGVLGFEYGYSLDAPDSLVIWEAQFGDFVNGAQVILDQFISSGEDKWELLSGVVLLLPHGFEGAGPEHSSARLERFLQMCAEDNMQVVNLTTPAQIFHCLRRQVKRPWRKPLVVMSPKSLLRHKDATSSLEDLSEGRFQEVIADSFEASKVKRLLLCSGRVYYDLVAAKQEQGRDDVGIVRLEQLYPLPQEALFEALRGLEEGVPVVWVQDEPRNMGAWYFLRAQFGESLWQRHPFQCVSRQESASPATGSPSSHKIEQEALLREAFGFASSPAETR